MKLGGPALSVSPKLSARKTPFYCFYYFYRMGLQCPWRIRSRTLWMLESPGGSSISASHLEGVPAPPSLLRSPLDPTGSCQCELGGFLSHWEGPLQHGLGICGEGGPTVPHLAFGLAIAESCSGGYMSF